VGNWLLGSSEVFRNLVSFTDIHLASWPGAFRAEAGLCMNIFLTWNELFSVSDYGLSQLVCRHAAMLAGILPHAITFVSGCCKSLYAHIAVFSNRRRNRSKSGQSGQLSDGVVTFYACKLFTENELEKRPMGFEPTTSSLGRRILFLAEIRRSPVFSVS